MQCRSFDNWFILGNYRGNSKRKTMSENIEKREFVFSGDIFKSKVYCFISVDYLYVVG